MTYWQPRADLSPPLQDWVRGWYGVRRGGEVPPQTTPPHANIARFMERVEEPGDEGQETLW